MMIVAAVEVATAAVAAVVVSDSGYARCRPSGLRGADRVQILQR